MTTMVPLPILPSWVKRRAQFRNEPSTGELVFTHIYIYVYTDILKIVEVVLVLRVCKYVSIYCVDVTYVSDYMC